MRRTSVKTQIFPKAPSRFLQRAWRISQERSQAMTPRPDFPVRGPAGDHQFRKLLTPGRPEASVVKSPMTNTPKAEERMRPGPAPSGDRRVVGLDDSSSLSSKDGGHFVQKRPKNPCNGRREKGENKKNEDSLPQLLSFQKRGAIVGHDKGDRRCQDRRRPADVLLPLHPKGVPGRLRGIGQEPRAGALWDGRPIPGINDVGPAEHRDPAYDRHPPDPGVEAAKPFPKPFRRDKLFSKAPKARKASGEGDEIDGPENCPVQDCLEFS